MLGVVMLSVVSPRRVYPPKFIDWGMPAKKQYFLNQILPNDDEHYLLRSPGQILLTFMPLRPNLEIFLKSLPWLRSEPGNL
jgi:hypothetical protein